MTTPIRVAPCCLNDKIKFPAVYGVPKGHDLLPSREKDSVLLEQVGFKRVRTGNVYVNAVSEEDDSLRLRRNV